MNQSILFPDLEQWQATLSAVTFPAMVNGFQVTCAVKLQVLRALAARMNGMDESLTPLMVFQRLRWQLEEAAAQAIRNEDYDAQGWVWIAACDR